jgi:DNA helicase-2/ATP-dependent DNA helicase PcrA
MAKRKKAVSATGLEEFETGDQVDHPMWGVGTVLFKNGTGDRQKVIVVFPEQGQKKLLVKMAKLTKVH